MKPAPERNWAPTFIGTVLALSLILYAFFMTAATDQPQWTYDLSEDLAFMGLLWLLRIAIGARRLLR